MTQGLRHLNCQGLLQVSGFIQSNFAPIADITNPEESESSDSEASKPSGASAVCFCLCDALCPSQQFFHHVWMFSCLPVLNQN